jgi:hypothetical protein
MAEIEGMNKAHVVLFALMFTAFPGVGVGAVVIDVRAIGGTFDGLGAIKILFRSSRKPNETSRGSAQPHMKRIK